jgi:hypothetical protein
MRLRSPSHAGVDVGSTAAGASSASSLSAVMTMRWCGSSSVKKLVGFPK